MRTVNLCYLFLIFFLLFDVFFNSSILHSRGTLRVIQILFSFFLSSQQYKTILSMYRVYETCKANETQSGHFVQNSRIIILSDCICGTKFGNHILIAVIFGQKYKESLKRTNCLQFDKKVSIRMLCKYCEARKNSIDRETLDHAIHERYSSHICWITSIRLEK